MLNKATKNPCWGVCVCVCVCACVCVCVCVCCLLFVVFLCFVFRFKRCGVKYRLPSKMQVAELNAENY